MTLEEYRCFYAEEIQFSANVSGTSLLEAFVRVPREDFLGPGPWKIAAIDLGLGGTSYIETPDADPRHVYHNVSVALDASRDLNNGQPAALAKWIEALNLKTGDHVYHLGCGTGYYTAIMARIVGSSGRVLASEVDTDLAVQARNNLAAYSNVSVESGDGTTVDPGERDAIFINAGVTHPNPKWLDRLREGGTLILPLTMVGGMAIGATATIGKGVMAKVTREADGFSARVVSIVAIYSCLGMRDPQMEQALGKAMTGGRLFKMRSLRRDVHQATDTCLVHGSEICLSSLETGTPVAA